METLGYGQEILRELFPDFVAAIGMRQRQYKSDMRKIRIKALDAEVLSIATALVSTGIAPRNDCIVPLLSAGSLQDWHAITRSIHKARRALGYEAASSNRGPRKAN